MGVLMDESLAQQIVDAVKSICGQDINFINASGTIIASTDSKRVGQYHEAGHKVAISGTLLEVSEDNAYTGTRKGINLPVFYNHALLMVIGISGEPDVVRAYADLAHRISILLVRERDFNALSRIQSEKAQFVINTLIQQNYPDPEYMNTVLQEFKVNATTNNRLILVKVNSKTSPAKVSKIGEIVENAFTKAGVSVHCFNYPFDYLAVIDADQFEKAEHIFRDLSKRNNDCLKVAIGKNCQIYQLSDSYHSALMALKSVQEKDTAYVRFEDLTLELVLSSMSQDTRQAFLNKTISCLSEKDKILLKTYFEENCSLQRCCDKLFIHKNTVQYQLNHISEVSGINPRRFEDAVLLYLALNIG